MFFLFLSLLLLLLTRRAEEKGGGAALPGVRATDALEVALLGDHLRGAAVAAKPPRRLREAAIAGRVWVWARRALSPSLLRCVWERYFFSMQNTSPLFPGSPHGILTQSKHRAGLR